MPSLFPSVTSRRDLIWVPTSANIIVPINTGVNLLIPLAPIGALAQKVTLVADRANGTAVYIGPRTMTLAAGATTQPNVAFFQLDAGMRCQIEVDDPFRESFDMGYFFAIQNSATVTCALFFTLWEARPH